MAKPVYETDSVCPQCGSNEVVFASGVLVCFRCPAAALPSFRVYDCRCNVCKAEFKDVSADGLDRFVLEHQHPKEGQSLSLKVRRRVDT